MTTTLPMRCRADAAALRQHLRAMYHTEDAVCCHSLLSMAFVSFEQRCMQAVGRTGPGFETVLADGLRLEYQHSTVLVRRSPAAPLAAGTGKRAAPEP